MSAPTVTVTIMGKKHDVPLGLTILKAYEYAGYQLVRGVGCRGGVCGACATVYRLPNESRRRACLAWARGRRER
jgi:ferredoxin